MAVTAKSFVSTTLQTEIVSATKDLIDKICASETTTLTKESDYILEPNASLTWGTASSGSVSISNTPVLSITAGSEINYLTLYYQTGGGDVEKIRFTISEEVFTYLGSITIDSLTLSISSTIS